ncbi:hypothetical protein SYNTR_1714 [Candidatus Syntrophocurvum alkaliphilum]|uniref:SLH domain-containing protein n=2 Tax=Candidatus Syntrophocurvum alkaliphilum TaxID=2293317 RepID=A0A6I6DJW3_9FIRM|nr:hypothetical protein SYNTR_1714 [Candidatus Syntrophocurvum alkaliphilum]
MGKKLMIIIIMTTVLLFGTMGTVAAANFTDIAGNPQEDAILEMSRLGILEGVGNDQFAPNAELNRAAAAKVAGYLLGYTEQDAVKAAQTEAIFTDIVGTSHEWALGWINLMSEEGILRGTGDGLYAPGDPLQMVHWGTILIRVLEHEQSGMNWPNDYNDMVNNLGLEAGLYYNDTGIMNRAEMARMTTTALYNVERPDGQRIVDIVSFRADTLDDWHVPEQPESKIYHNADISVQLSETVVAPGGGQTITITATAIHGPDNRPAAFTNIEFFASVGPHDRNDQLSVNESLTDINGVATSTYTTVAADDGNTIELVAVIQTDNDEWLDRRTFALASNTAAFVSGRIINPFNGEPVTDPEIIVGLYGNPQIHTRLIADDQGNYSGPINANTYDVNIRMNLGDSPPYPGEFSGSHFRIDDNGDVWIGIQKRAFSAGNSYTIPSELGVVTGVHNRPAGTEIYIVRKSDQFTQIANISSNGRFMTTLPPGQYWIGNSVGTTLKDNINIQKGSVTKAGTF